MSPQPCSQLWEAYGLLANSFNNSSWIQPVCQYYISWQYIVVIKSKMPRGVRASPKPVGSSGSHICLYKISWQSIHGRFQSAPKSDTQDISILRDKMLKCHSVCMTEISFHLWSKHNFFFTCILSPPPGRLDFFPGCSGHGSFSLDLCGCICEEGWTGKNCSEPRCPDDCSGQGVCIEGECVCDRDFGGENCSEPRCPSDCSGRGLCIDGECVCEESFTGEDCMVGRCLNDCSDQGLCINGTCQCRPGYVGEDCSLVYCANNCSKKGVCKDGFCVCQDGFAGDDCNSGRLLLFILHIKSILWLLSRIKSSLSDVCCSIPWSRNSRTGSIPPLKPPVSVTRNK